MTYTTDDYEVNADGTLSRRIGKTWQTRKLHLDAPPLVAMEVEKNGAIAGCIVLTEKGTSYMVSGLWDKTPKVEKMSADDEANR